MQGRYRNQAVKASNDYRRSPVYEPVNTDNPAEQNEAHRSQTTPDHLPLARQIPCLLFMLCDCTHSKYHLSSLRNHRRHNSDTRSQCAYRGVHSKIRGIPIPDAELPTALALLRESAPPIIMCIIIMYVCTMHQ